MRHIPVKVIAIQSLVLLISIVAFSFNNPVPHQFKEERCGLCHINYESPISPEITSQPHAITAMVRKVSLPI